jgi:hypothetical protein
MESQRRQASDRARWEIRMSPNPKSCTWVIELCSGSVPWDSVKD